MSRIFDKTFGLVFLLLLLALSFRLFIALRLPNDTPGDSIVYSQMARNVLEQHVYSHDEEPPYHPSLIRLPGYPFFLAAIYAVAGHGNNTAVRVVQAIVDTATCGLVALVAFQWVGDEKLKRRAALIALALAAFCPFTSIYVATILTEVPTNFLAVLLCLLATLAFKSKDARTTLLLWALAGLTAGAAVFFRPDSGLFAAAVGFTIVLTFAKRSGGKLSARFIKSVIAAAIFSCAFCLVLVPWTIRNRRVFGVFQPLSPAHGEMPGEFVPRGYLMWLRSWLDDGRYIGPVLWRLDTSQIKIDAFPKRAFDSVEERDRVAALLEKYNGTAESPTPSPSPQVDSDEENDEEESDEPEEDDSGDEVDEGVEMTPEIDAGFAQIAKERIARAPLRYYVVLPLDRAKSLWFDTHSQYYPFEGNLLPWENMDFTIHQQYWLTLFAGLTWIYTILGAIGAWVLWRAKTTDARIWLLLVSLIVFLRLGFFSTLENPEPRYVVEVFPFLAVLGGVGLSYFVRQRQSRTSEDGAP